MILEKSTGYWSTAITVARHPDRDAWSASLEFLDDGWVGDDAADAGRVCTEGTLRTRYFIKDGERTSGLSAAIDSLIADATRLGVEFGGPGERPALLLYRNDGRSSDWPPPPGWRELLTAEAARIGWRSYETKV